MLHYKDIGQKFTKWYTYIWTQNEIIVRQTQFLELMIISNRISYNLRDIQKANRKYFPIMLEDLMPTIECIKYNINALNAINLKQRRFIVIEYWTVNA